MTTANPRYRTGALVRMARDPGGFAAMQRLGAEASITLYGTSRAARSLRAIDVRRQKGYIAAHGPDAWREVLRGREVSLDIYDGHVVAAFDRSWAKKLGRYLVAA